MRFYSQHFTHPGQWKVVDLIRRTFSIDESGDQLIRQGNLRWKLDPADHMQAGLFWCGEMDRWEIYHLTRLLDSDSVFFDVGANLGYYAITVSSRQRALSYAFEPEPAMFHRLQENICLNQLGRLVKAEAIALSDREGSIALKTFRQNSGKTSITDQPGDVPTKPLDEFVAEQHIKKVTAMKIDVEGAELKVLLGARETLERDRPVLFLEVNPTALRNHGISAEDLESCLIGLDYQFFEIRKKELSMMSELSSIESTINLVCRQSPS